MRFPSFKSWLIFAAGFASCVVCLIAFIFSAYFFWLKPMQRGIGANLSEPDFFSPKPASFDLAAVGKQNTHLKLEEYRGRIIVLNVWATWCGPCMMELPSLGKLAAHYAGSPEVVVVCVSQEPSDIVFRNQAAQDSGAPLYSLNGPDLPRIYETDGIPATFVIDPQGMIVFKHVGAADWFAPSVTNFIESLKPKAITGLQSTPSDPPVSAKP
jgi:thiol-disulfide isomerase/thioredoxin